MNHVQDFVNSLLKQFQYTGLLLELRKYKEEDLTSELYKRMGAGYAFFMMVARAELNVKLEDPIPFIYNTHEWPEDVPIAGYAGSSSDTAFGVLPKSYIMSWNYQVSFFQKNSLQLRFLKGALYICVKKSLPDAVRYLTDLLRTGVVVNYEITYRCITSLLNAYMRSENNEALLDLFFSTNPVSDKDWINQEIKISHIEHLPKKKGVNEIISQILDQCLKDVEAVRDAQDFDSWTAGQSGIEGLIRLLDALVEEYIKLPSLSLKAVLSQLEEIKADTGVTRLTRDGVTRYLSPAFSYYRGLSIIIEAKSPENWKDIVINERAYIPRVLAEQYFSGEITYPEKWKCASHTLAPAVYLADKADLNGLFLHNPINNDNTLLDNIFSELKEKIPDLISNTDHHHTLKVLLNYATYFPYLHFIHYELAICYDRLSLRNDALSYIKSALLLDLNDPNKWQSFGVILKAAGHDDQAMVMFVMSEYLAKTTREIQ